MTPPAVTVRCTANALIVRTKPGGVDLSQRLTRGQVVTAIGESYDGQWVFITDPAGWVSKKFVEDANTPGQHERWIGAALPNFSRGRSGILPIDMIVIHVIEGSLRSADEWFSDGRSIVSAHYGIGLNREIHQYVREEDTAFHAGRVKGASAPLVLSRPGVNPNSYSIGIEHEGTATSEWPDTMYEDSARLVAEIANRHSIPIDRTHVVGHREIFADKTCPGKGDVDRIVRRAQEVAL